MTADEFFESDVESDDTMTQEAVKYLLRGEGRHSTDGFALEVGFAFVVVKPFGREGVDVWFHRSSCSGLPGQCSCRSHHVEFGRTGGEVLILQPDEG